MQKIFKLFVYIWRQHNKKKNERTSKYSLLQKFNWYSIPTKYFPTFNANAYMTDELFDYNIEAIDEAYAELIELSNNYEAIVFPINGIGIGLAKLPKCAPNTFKYIK